VQQLHHNGNRFNRSVPTVTFAYPIYGETLKAFGEIARRGARPISVLTLGVISRVRVPFRWRPMGFKREKKAPAGAFLEEGR
jgi:hypothetical protein